MSRERRPALHALNESRILLRLEEEASAHPQWADIRNVYGLALLTRGESERARHQFREALNVNPRFSWAQLNLASALGLAGNFEEARKIAATAGDPAPGARAFTEAWLHLLNSKPQAALGAARKAPAAVLDRPDGLMLRSAIASSQGLMEESADLVNQLHAHPDWPELEPSYLEMESQPHGTPAIFPGLSALWRRVSRIHAYDDAPANAMETAQRAFHYWSDRGAHVTHLGMLHSLQGDFNVAAACYQEGMRLSPADPEPAAALASFWAANGDPDQAVAFLRDAIRRAPGYPDLHRRLGVLESARGNDAAALSAFERALEINPLFAAARLEMGEALMRMENWEAALSCYQTAADAGLDATSIETQLERCHQALGRRNPHLPQHSGEERKAS